MSGKSNKRPANSVLNYFKRIRSVNSDEAETRTEISSSKTNAAANSIEISGKTSSAANIGSSQTIALAPEPEPSRELNNKIIETQILEDSNFIGENIICNNDIGLHLANIADIDDDIRYKLLKNHWMPDANFNFPVSIHKKRGREERRRANHNHFEKHNWLVFSREKQGLLCKYCALFSEELVGGRHMQSHNVVPQKLVRVPLFNFSKLTGQDGDLLTHETTKYHLKCVNKGKYLDLGIPT